MSKLEELRSEVSALRDEIAELAATEDITPEQDARLDEAVAQLPEREAALAKEETRAKVIADVQAGKARLFAGDSRDSAPSFIRTPDSADVLNDRSATPQQIGDAIARHLEAADVPVERARQLIRRHGRHDQAWARNLLARSTEVYTEAFEKYMLGRTLELTDEERAALVVGTNTQGGYLVPTHLDPTIILTNDGTNNAIRGISRNVTLTVGDTWNGVTSAGATSVWKAELAEATDGTPATDTAGIPVHALTTLLQASIEAFQDIAGLSSDALMLIAESRDRLEAAAHATGSGNGQPTGIFTALDANTNVEIVSGTAATIARPDLVNLYNGVGRRFRGRGKWVMNPTWLLEIQALGTALGASYTTDLAGEPTPRIFGKEVVDTDDAPEVTTTTVRDNRIVFGDFSNYVIVDKPGSTAIEFIPHMFHTGNNLPAGVRAWYAHFRTGADSVNDLAFRLLQDKTSA